MADTTTGFTFFMPEPFDLRLISPKHETLSVKRVRGFEEAKDHAERTHPGIWTWKVNGPCLYGTNTKGYGLVAQKGVWLY